MSRASAKLMAVSALAAAGVCAFAQGGWSGCIDPMNMAPFSTPFGIEENGESLMEAEIGTVGTVGYGPVSTMDGVICFGALINANVRGRIGFSVGSTGSVQSTLDDGMPLTFGFPYVGGTWGYENLSTDGALSLVGANGLSIAFTGASDRYFYVATVNGTTNIECRVDIIGDASRVQWTLTNQDTAASHNLGLWFGQWPAFLDSTGHQSGLRGGYPTNGQPPAKDLYAVVPGVTPPTTEQRYKRAINPSSYPAYVDLDFGQTEAYGLRVENGPTADTEDPQGLNSDATQSDEFALGQKFFLLGPDNGGDLTFPDVEFGPGNTGGDVTYLGQPGWIQKFYDTATPSGAARTIVEYFRSTWGVANYFKPYSVVLDAPQLIPADSSSPTGLSTPAGGYDIRVYVDNTRGFSTADQSIVLNDVSITIKLPNGLNLASGDTATKVIPVIQPGGRNLAFVDYHVIPDGIAYGQLPYSVTVAPTPGPTKTVTGVITVAATPKLSLLQGPNLVSTPFVFNDSSWEAILGLVAGQDFFAYNFDPAQNGYVLSTSAQRGKGTWLVMANSLGTRVLQSNPQPPTDESTGAPAVLLPAGWNLISNPYNYEVPIGQILGATNANSNTDFTWDSLVSQGFVDGALAYFNQATGSYSYLQNDSDMLLPNQGYWLYVNVQQPLTLVYPPVFQEFLPGSTRSATNQWTQTQNKWRLQLTARTANSIDDQNFVGVVPDAATVTKLQIAKPPIMPKGVSNVRVAISGTIGGRPIQLAQALSTGGTKQQYTMTVTSPTAGDVTLTWPNIATIPKNVQVRLIDTATNATRVLNQSSGYTFTAQANSTRTFTVQIQPQTPGRATIGAVLVTRAGKGTTGPVTVTYTLGVSATTSVQILNAAGVPVYTVTSGRADQAGPNSVIWNLRDNANRNVAPGTYRVVILASTPDGSTARKVQIVNVTR